MHTFPRILLRARSPFSESLPRNSSPYAQQSMSKVKPNLHSIQVVPWEHEVVGGFQSQLFPRATEANEDGETPLPVGHHAELGLDLCSMEGKRGISLLWGKSGFSRILSYKEVVSPILTPSH